MKIWETLKRLNNRYDDWSMRKAEEIIANIDDGGKFKKSLKKYIGISDLISKRRRA